MEFNIGDRVRVRQYDDIPEELRNRGLGKSAGNDGEIVDILRSNAKDTYVYRIHFDECDTPSRTDFVEGTFDLISELEKAQYDYEFEYLENLVVARLYEIKDDSKKLIARGHGHIFHDGVYGIAQAASYALKKIYRFLEGDDEAD
jgi:hypothetical protein